MFSYLQPEKRIPANHPLRKIRELVREVLKELNHTFGRLYAQEGRPSIPPEQLLSALLLQVLYSVRSERQLMEPTTICCFAGSSASRRTIRSGTRPCSPRTGNAFKKAMCSRSS
jgi:hypothetical protein